MKTLEEQIKECNDKIEHYTKKRKDLLDKQRKMQKAEEEKQLKDIGNLLKQLGLNSAEDIKKVKNDIQELYGVQKEINVEIGKKNEKSTELKNETKGN